MRNSGTGVELALIIFKVREWQIESYKFFASRPQMNFRDCPDCAERSSCLI